MRQQTQHVQRIGMLRKPGEDLPVERLGFGKSARLVMGDGRLQGGLNVHLRQRRNRNRPRSVPGNHIQRDAKACHFDRTGIAKEVKVGHPVHGSEPGLL